ncbi:MAG TPA: M56 family metallopeptidase, partial [Pedobacter sp.]
MEWLIYLSKVSVCTCLFYAFYHFFLKKLTFFNSNRSYLIITLILSVAIPALQFNVEVSGADTPQTTSPSPYVDGATGLTIPEDSYYMINTTEELSKGMDWSSVLMILYVIVSLTMFVNSLYQVSRLLFYTRHVFDRIGPLKVIFKPEGFTNCSFFNYVFVDQKDLSSWEMHVFLQHETAHAMKYHSVDKLLIALSKVSLWFNPFVYLYERELNQLHEYEADKVTSEIIGNQSYATLLLQKASKQKAHSFVHSFAVKPLKRRILMLFTNQSTNMKKLKYFAALPFIAILVLGFSVEYVPSVKKVIKSVPDSPVYRHRIKRTPEMVKYQKTAEEWRKTDDYKQKVRAMAQVAGKTLTGTVKPNTEVVRQMLNNRMLFVSDNVTYYLSLADGSQDIRDLLKPNSMVTVRVHSPMVTKGSKLVELAASSLKVNGHEIYKMKALVIPPFLHEVNKVRFADGLVTKVTSNLNGKKQLHISANGYTFLLKIGNEQVSLAELDEVKVGDNVRFRFVHEQKTGAKAYLINDWVSISKDIKSYGIKNKV